MAVRGQDLALARRSGAADGRQAGSHQRGLASGSTFTITLPILPTDDGMPQITPALLSSFVLNPLIF